ncbi:MAG: hypothetical protein EON91_12235 [Brevundimonas sp.]|uniref:hypothetical protein n=1 Tax=Brevundimonas sp. TaxID=1871086 RepID=UPI0011F4A432|nr:hypothetical protein [Brevundimonas sp.]RZJ16672.1 MAG: hypothetical protein EON91_12235 [Brevundimonas sp.]
MNNPFRPRPPNEHDPQRATDSSADAHRDDWFHLRPRTDAHHTPAANHIVGDITNGGEGRKHRDKDLI